MFRAHVDSRIALAFSVWEGLQNRNERATLLARTLCVCLAMLIAYQLWSIGVLLFRSGSETNTSPKPHAPFAAPTVEQRRTDASAVVTAHLFGIVSASEAEVDAQPLADNSLSLTGTIANSDGTGFAMIGIASQVSRLYSVGDALPNSYRLASVYPHHVVLDRSGTLVKLSLQLASVLSGYAPTPSAFGLSTDAQELSAQDEVAAQESQLPGERVVDKLPLAEHPIPHRDHD